MGVITKMWIYNTDLWSCMDSSVLIFPYSILHKTKLWKWNVGDTVDSCAQLISALLVWCLVLKIAQFV